MVSLLMQMLVTLSLWPSSTLEVSPDLASHTRMVLVQETGHRGRGQASKQPLAPGTEACASHMPPSPFRRSLAVPQVSAQPALAMLPFRKLPSAQTSPPPSPPPTRASLVDVAAGHLEQKHCAFHSAATYLSIPLPCPSPPSPLPCFPTHASLIGAATRQLASIREPRHTIEHRRRSLEDPCRGPGLELPQTHVLGGGTSGNLCPRVRVVGGLAGRMAGSACQPLLPGTSGLRTHPTCPQPG